MSNVIKLTKKTFTWSVVVTTILWSVGVAALVPVVANAAVVCPTLQAGDEFKLAGNPAVYVVNKNGERMYWPNGHVRKSYLGSDFSNVVTLPDSSCLPPSPTAPPFGANFYPGTLVKLTISPDVFVMESNNQMRKLASEAAAIALYGSDWATRVFDVNDAFWPNSTIATGEVDGSTLSEGMVGTNGGKTYQMMNNELKEVDGSVGSHIPMISISDSLLAGLTMSTTKVTPASLTADPTQGAGGSGSGTTPPGGTSTSTPPATGSLAVSLSGNTPAAGNIIADSTANEYPQGHIPFLTVNFAAGSSAAVISELKFHRTGISADADIGNLYIYDGMTKLAEFSSFNEKVATFSSSAGLFTVPAGETKSITLRGDLARGSTSVTSGKTIAFSMNGTGDVTAAVASVTGSFPIQGSSMSTAAVSDLGHMYLSNYTTYPSTIKADEAGKELWRMTLNADSKDMEVRKLMLTMVGTIATTEIDNLKLEVGGVQVGTAQSISSDKTVTFDLTGAPIQIDAGQTKLLVLRGDMKGGSGRNFKFTIQRQTDMMVYDREYNVYNPVAKDAVTTAFSVIQPVSGNGTSVDSGTLTIGVHTDSPTGNIADAGTNLTLGVFSFEAAGEDVKVDNLNIDCNGSGSNEVLANVKVLFNGSQVGTTDSSLTCDNGTDSTTYTFGNTMIVRAGVVSKVAIVADTTGANIANNDTLSVALNVGSSNATGQVTLTSLSTTAQTARTLTVKSGTVSVAESPSLGDKTSTIPTGTLNAKERKIASFTITAGAGEAVDVTQISLADNATTAMSSNFQNLKVKNGDTQIGTTIGTLNSTVGTYTFTPASAIRLASGEQYVVDVYADIKSSAADHSGDGMVAYAAIRLAANAITATGVSTSQSANSSNSATDLQNVYIAQSGTLTVAVDGNTAQAAQLVMGGTGIELGSFDFTANASEDLQVSDIVLTVSTSANGAGGLKNLQLFVDGSSITSPVQMGTAAATDTWYAVTFTVSGFVIPADQTKTVVVKGDVTPYTDGATSNSKFHMGLVPNIGGGTEPISGIGKSSGTSLTISGSSITLATEQVGSEMTIYRTVVSAAFAGDTPSGSAVGGDDAIVGKFVLTNTSNTGNYKATVTNLDVGLSQTGVSLTAARQVKVYKDSITTANLLITSTYGSTGSIIDTAFAAATFVDVEIAAGQSKTFIVTLDSQDAGTNDKISVTLAQNDITWGDGITAAITTVDSLPLTPSKTLSY